MKATRRYALLVAVVAFTVGLFLLATAISGVRYGEDWADLYTYLASVRELRKSQPGNLEFGFTRCGGPGPSHGTEVRQVEWVDNNELHCVVTIDANCGDEFWIGNYKMEGESSLVLEYTTLRPWGEMGCLCQVELQYRISDLEKRDYSITVRHLDVVTR